jgi:hypothetical protein
MNFRRPENGHRLPIAWAIICASMLRCSASGGKVDYSFPPRQKATHGTHEIC